MRHKEVTSLEYGKCLKQEKLQNQNPLNTKASNIFGLMLDQVPSELSAAQAREVYPLKLYHPNDPPKRCRLKAGQDLVFQIFHLSKITFKSAFPQI